MAMVSIVVALGLTALVAQQFELSVFVINMLTGMGLALGIDYSLFVVSRYREERAKGNAEFAAIEISGATASRAVLFSGTVFVIAMFGMLLVPSSIMRSLAVGAILVGIVSVIAALTLLPAVLGLLRDRVNALRIPFVGRRSDEARSEGRFWGAIVRGVLRRPALSLTLSVAALVALALPVLTMNVGTSGVSSLPDRFVSKQGFVALERDFPGSTHGSGRDRRLGRLEPRGRDLRSPACGCSLASTGASGWRQSCAPPTARCSGALSPGRRRSGVERGDRRGARASDGDRRRDLRGHRRRGARRRHDVGEHRLLRLRDRPGAVGDRARAAADVRLPDGRLPLGRRRRDRRPPEPALGRARRTGCSSLVFQEGIGADLLGFQTTDAIEAWVPLFLFSVLFGLSMDYQVFLLSRIRERYDETRDTTDAVTFGVASTARIITGAALIIVAVFAGFARGDLIMFQQMGFGVAVALLLDATVIRSVVLPSADEAPRRVELVPAALARLAAAARGRAQLARAARGRPELKRCRGQAEVRPRPISLVPSPRDAPRSDELMTRRTRVVGTLVLTAAAIAYLFWKVELDTTLDVLADTNLGWFALAVAIMVFTVPILGVALGMAARGARDPTSGFRGSRAPTSSRTRPARSCRRRSEAMRCASSRRRAGIPGGRRW